MPIYEYLCRSCGHRFEAIRRMSEREQAPACPKCEGRQTGLALSAPAVLSGHGGNGGCGGNGACSTNAWTGGG